MLILKRNSTGDIWVEAYTDDRTGLPVINATVVGTIYKQDGTAVTGATNLAMPYTAAAGTHPARYLGTVLNTVALPEESYDLKAIGTNPDGVREWNETIIMEDG